MKTIFVSGSDTGIGKTHVTGLLAGALSAAGARVQIVKPVQTGVDEGEPLDAELAAGGDPAIDSFTLFRFHRPLSPLHAALLEKRSLSLEALLRAVRELPRADYRLVEGAGGLAVPLDEKGDDWADFARLLGVDASLLVVEDRLGAINQARLLLTHAAARHLPTPLLVLNRIKPLAEEVAEANLEGLRACGAPLLRLSDGKALAEVLHRHLKNKEEAHAT